MILIGLGSNTGDRADFLKKAVRRLVSGPEPLLTRWTLSPLYESAALLPPGAPEEWNRPFFNMILGGESNRDPRSFLEAIKKIEIEMGREISVPRWSPRKIDIDLLAWNDLVIDEERFKVPHAEIERRLFVLKPLRDVAPRWIHPRTGKQIEELIQTAPQFPDASRSRDPIVKIMSVINVTPDSFSGDGIAADLENLPARARKALDAGAAIIDVGAESTRPGARPLSQSEEWSRLKPALEKINREVLSKTKAILSIDTRHAATARLALDMGAAMINDVAGVGPEMAKAVAQSDAKVVFMHSLSVPADPARVLPAGESVIDALLHWGKRKISELVGAGISRERMIFDPGIGFGKTPAQSMEILADARRFHELGCEFLIGHSRKSFLGSITKAPAAERDLETALMTARLSAAGPDYLRVHDVGVNVRALRFSASAGGVFV